MSITNKILQLVGISTVVVAANVAAADVLKITDLIITPGTAVKREPGRGRHGEAVLRILEHWRRAVAEAGDCFDVLTCH